LDDVAEPFRDLAHQVLLLERGHPLDPLPEGCEFLARPDDRALSAGCPKMPRQPPTVATGHDRDAEAIQPFDERLAAAPMLLEATELASNQGPSPGPRRFLEIRGGAVVADQGIGHDHHLAGVRRVRKDLLVS